LKAAETSKVICAWCGKVIRIGKEPASHGICKECAAKMRADGYQKFYDKQLKKEG